MKVKEIIDRAINNEEISKDERYEMFHYFRHIPNAMKMDGEMKVDNGGEWVLFKPKK